MEFQSKGVRALVLMHDGQLRALLSTWRLAKVRGIALPATEDPDYKDLDHLLRHLLRAARGYLTWICEVLGRPDPQVPMPPEVGDLEREADAYQERILEAWKLHLSTLTDEQAGAATTYLTRWGHPYTIEAMLEHAVVHPMRHRLQLEELIQAETK